MPGDNKQPWWQKMFMTAAIAENPAVMTASGHKVENDGSVSVDNYNDPGVIQLREKALPTAVKAGLLGGTGVYALGAYGPLAMVNFGMKNIALPVLGGEVINEVTRKVSNNKYNSFGDFVYNGSRLANVANGTFMETPFRFITDMSNPAYWIPYGKAVGYAMDGARTLSNAYNNLPVKIKFTPRENFRYRNIGNNDGLIDLLESGIVRAKQKVEPQLIKGINFNKTYSHPYFGGKGQLIQTGGYKGKWFVGAEDFGNNFRRPKSTGGLIPINNLTIDDVTINRRIFPKLTNSPYIEWSLGEFNTPHLNKELLLSLKELPRIVDVYSKSAEPWQLTKKQFNKIVRSNKSTNELLKRILQSRYQFARGDSSLLDHNLDDFAQYIDRGSNLLPGARGGGRHDLDPFDFLGIPSEGVWYGTNNLGYASRFAINDKKIPFKHGSMGIVRVKDAVFNGRNRRQWINDNPIPIIDDQGMFSLNGMIGRKVPNSSGMYDTYIFKGNYGSKVGEVVKTYKPEEISNYFEQLKSYPSTIDVAHWKHGGKLGKKQ